MKGKEKGMNAERPSLLALSGPFTLNPVPCLYGSLMFRRCISARTSARRFRKSSVPPPPTGVVVEMPTPPPLPPLLPHPQPPPPMPMLIAEPEPERSRAIDLFGEAVVVERELVVVHLPVILGQESPCLAFRLIRAAGQSE